MSGERVPVPDGYVSECRYNGTVTITGGDCFLSDPRHRHPECGQAMTAVHPDFGSERAS